MRERRLVRRAPGGGLSITGFIGRAFGFGDGTTSTSNRRLTILFVAMGFAAVVYPLIRQQVNGDAYPDYSNLLFGWLRNQKLR